MRDLTTEELALAPEWATHYKVDGDGDVLFESEDCFQWLVDGGFEAKGEHSKGVSYDAIKIKGKPFDITQHEWSDEFTYFDFELHKDRGGIVIDGEVNRSDIIAIAKALGVTAEDLK